MRIAFRGEKLVSSCQQNSDGEQISPVEMSRDFSAVWMGLREAESTELFRQTREFQPGTEAQMELGV